MNRSNYFWYKEIIKLIFVIVQYGPKFPKRWVKKSFEKEVMINSEFFNLVSNATKDGKLVSKENMAFGAAINLFMCTCLYMLSIWISQHLIKAYWPRTWWVISLNLLSELVNKVTFISLSPKHKFSFRHKEWIFYFKFQQSYYFAFLYQQWSYRLTCHKVCRKINHMHCSNFNSL